MARFLLIHGACHGAWCWDRVLPLLDHGAHQARAIDLPAHGRDRTPPATASLALYARAIAAAIDDPVVLVGHSAAGFAITAAAELAPDRIVALVYLAAYVPRPGQSLADLRRAGPSQPLRAAIRVAPDRLSFSLDRDLVADALYHDCPPDAVAMACANLCPEPIAPQETALTLTPRSASLPRHYIRCAEDRAIPSEYQAAMAATWPGTSVTTLPASHSPFLSAPDVLARRLLAIAGQP